MTFFIIYVYRKQEIDKKLNYELEFYFIIFAFALPKRKSNFIIRNYFIIKHLFLFTCVQPDSLTKLGDRLYRVLTMVCNTH
jgi:hypothetical protein